MLLKTLSLNKLEPIRSEFFLSIVCTTETSQCNPNQPKKLKCIAKFQSILNWMLQILHHYCRKEYGKNKKLTLYWTKYCYHFLPFYLLTAFHASCALFNGRIFSFPGTSTSQIYLGFSMSQVFSIHAINNIIF